MKKLTIDTLKGYLGTGLKMQSKTRSIFTLGSLGIYKSGLVITDEDRLSYLESKPILYPIDCLDKPIVVHDYNQGKPFIPIDEISQQSEDYTEFRDIKFNLYNNDIGMTPYWVIQLFQKWFINYQNLDAVSPFDLPINPYEKGLAIDKNTIK